MAQKWRSVGSSSGSVYITFIVTFLTRMDPLGAAWKIRRRSRRPRLPPAASWRDPISSACHQRSGASTCRAPPNPTSMYVFSAREHLSYTVDRRRSRGACSCRSIPSCLKISVRVPGAVLPSSHSRRTVLVEPEYLVGRDPACSIRPDFRTISSRHCRIFTETDPKGDVVCRLQDTRCAPGRDLFIILMPMPIARTALL